VPITQSTVVQITCDLCGQVVVSNTGVQKQGDPPMTTNVIVCRSCQNRTIADLLSAAEPGIAERLRFEGMKD